MKLKKIIMGIANVTGKDNYGKPRQDYVDKLRAMTDTELSAACDQMIWLSGYAANNPRSDYHWQADACWDEANRREKPQIYAKAYEKIIKSL